jgi:hypothetical protein
MLTGPIWVTLAASGSALAVWFFIGLPVMRNLGTINQAAALRRARWLLAAATVTLAAAVGWMCQLALLAPTVRQAVAYAAAGGLALGLAIILFPSPALARRIKGLRARERAANKGGARHGR